jgi:hypothetical protein
LRVRAADQASLAERDYADDRQIADDSYRAVANSSHRGSSQPTQSDILGDGHGWVNYENRFFVRRRALQNWNTHLTLASFASPPPGQGGGIEGTADGSVEHVNSFSKHYAKSASGLAKAL